MMKRIILLIVVGLLIGSLVWILWTMGWVGNTPISLAENPPTRTLMEMSTATAFQPQTNTPTPTATPSFTLTPTASRTPTATPTVTPSLTSTSSSTPTSTSTPTPQKEAAVEGIAGRWPAFSLSCEARSAVDWGAYFGVEIDEIEFQYALPASENPDHGFVGDVNAPWGQTPPNAYGVHAEPVAELLRSYGLSALARVGMTFDEIRAEVSSGRPVIAWVVGRVGSGTPIPYASTEGEETTVARFEHTVIVIGYTQTEVTVLDGYWVYSRQIQDFKRSWGVLGNMAVVWGEDR